MNRYYIWLVNCIDGKGSYFNPRLYSKLLSYLDSIQFTYDLPGDGNRAQDGIKLRDRYVEDALGDPEDVEDRTWCSVLEMMVALARRCEDHIMDNPEIGDRAPLWFMVMITSLRLDGQTDRNYNQHRVTMAIWHLLNRTYGYDGLGGLFYIPDFDKDMTQIEIWYQMQAYMIRRYLPSA